MANETTNRTIIGTTPSIITNARNDIDVSDAIGIVIQILGIFIALVAIAVAVFYGRRQVQKFDQGWRPFAIHYLPGWNYQHPQPVAGNAIQLDHLYHNNQPRPSDANHARLTPSTTYKTQACTSLFDTPVFQQQRSMVN
ncbi:hypothetical protein LTS10_009796 [Elasticomyces elasticus]|nr:hypothetical protein LTS10_009796 [Elasticomyces elasticus]